MENKASNQAQPTENTDTENIESLIAKIKARAKEKQVEDAKQALHTQPEEDNEFLNALFLPDEQPPKLEQGIQPHWIPARHLRDLLLYEGKDFVQNLFWQILQRPAEPQAEAHYLELLQQGITRQRLVVRVMQSPEGRGKAANYHISGCERLIRREQWLQRFPRLERFLRPLANWYDRRTQPPGEEVLLVLIQQQNQGTYNNLKNILEFQQEIQQQNRLAFNNLLQQLQASQDYLAEVRRQFSYQQRNQDLFIQQLIQQNQQVLALLESGGKGKTKKQKEEAQKLLLQQQQVLESHQQDKMQAFYIAFEDACRGTREEIMHNLEVYLPQVQSCLQPLCLEDQRTPEQIDVLDLGCGRGEWLELLQQKLSRTQNWHLLGVDNNSNMVQYCQQAGLQVIQADVRQYLLQQANASIAVISAFHLIEHLPFHDLLSLFEECNRVLKPGGMILFETPNPENVLVGSHTFYHDPTHNNPLTPTAMSFLARYTGFTQIQIKRLNPYPEQARVPGKDPLTERVNGHFCGPQDYAIVALKPQPESADSETSSSVRKNN